MHGGHGEHGEMDARMVRHHYLMLGVNLLLSLQGIISSQTSEIDQMKAILERK